MHILLSKVYNLFLIPLAIPVVLMVRALKPLVLIRFGVIPSARIGHFAVNPEVYLCKRDLGIDGGRAYDIFYHTRFISNRQLKKMWDRVLRVSRFWRFAYIIDRLNRILPGSKKHTIPMDNEQDIPGLFARTPPHLFFDSKEESFGKSALKRLGILDENPFVCFHARDSAYLESISPLHDWRYHDYRDCSINNYVPMIKELVRRGYLVIRMGCKVKEPLPVADPMIIDYAAKHRTDFMDIYLSAKCKFFIGSTAGIVYVPAIFRRPVIVTNLIPLEHALNSMAFSLFIPKKLLLRKESRFLTFREILDSGIGRLTSSNDYDKYGLKVVENTAEEITAVTLEMDERLSGRWQTTEEDEELQRRFWSLYKDSRLHENVPSRIGAEFLRQNRELLN